MSSLTLPKSGSMRNGQLYQRPTLEPAINGNASSSLPTFPTPRAQNGEQRNMNIYARPLDQPQNLENALALLPTPSANDTTGAEPASQRVNRKAGGPMLRDLPHLLPTTTTHSSQHQQQDLEWGAVNDHTDLTQSPPVGDPQTQPNSLTTSPTSLVGHSTSQPSDDGKTSLDDQHQTPQLWEQQADLG
jgi:hypothetical protein